MREKKQKKELNIYCLLPLILAFSAVPLVVMLKVVPLDDITYRYWIGTKNNSDFFSYYKAVLLMICTVLSAAAYFAARYRRELTPRPLPQYYIPAAVYAFFIILSTLLSKYPATAGMGFADRYEGVYVLLSYLAIAFFAANMINSEKHLKICMAFLFISAGIIGTIGILQFFGLDFFRSYIGKLLILTPKYKSAISTLDFKFGKHTIYTTLYNTNFVGSYMAMLFPLALAAFLHVKKGYLKILTGIFACLMFANWIGCRSRAGYVGGIVAVLLLAVLTRKNIVKNLKSVLALLVCFVLIFAGMDSTAGGSLGGRILTTLSNIGDYTASDEERKIELASEAVVLKDIVLSGKKTSIVYGEDTLNLTLIGNEVVFSDTKGKQLVIKNNEAGYITFEDERYSAYTIVSNRAQNTLEVKLDKMQFGLFLDQSGFKIIGERNIQLDKIDYPEAFGFEGMEKFASMRGYIWSRSIPMLKKNILFGGGPDTYAIQFPQHDYVGKLRAFDTLHQIVDKPHNMYLQIGINTGVLSLIAVIVLLAVYFISSVKIYFFRELADEKSFIGGALFAAVLGYAAAGFANDSLVSVAPVFWALLGIGISCNYINTKEKAVEVTAGKPKPNQAIHRRRSKLPIQKHKI